MCELMLQEFIESGIVLKWSLLSVEFVNYFLVLFRDKAAFELHRWPQLAGRETKVVREECKFLDFLGVWDWAESARIRKYVKSAQRISYLLFARAIASWIAFVAFSSGPAAIISLIFV